MDRPAMVSQPSYAKSEVERMLSQPLMTMEECDKLRQLALSLPAEADLASPQEIARQLEFIAATLPAKNIDEATGQKRFAVYVRLLGGYSKEALSYMTERACRELDWFPTPRQCLSFLGEYRTPPTRKDRALRKCEDFTQSVFDQFVADLRDGPVDQSVIDAKPERWKRICVETGLLRREGEGYVQRLRKPE
jgi:hypothetical protein